MRDKPKIELIGEDGNIFAIMGRASRALIRAGMGDDAREMIDRVHECGSYNEALGMVSRYVRTELSIDDPGVIDAEDIAVDTEFTYSEDGITAYIETWFDVEKRFDVDLAGDDYLNLYATHQPETGTFKAALSVYRTDGKNELYDADLFPCERKLILSEMERISQEQTHMSLKEQFADWKKEYGVKQKNIPVKETKKHER